MDLTFRGDYSFIEKINSRLNRFKQIQNDRRVWGVEIFESIVSFKINHQAPRRTSAPVRNRSTGGGNDLFRNHPSNNPQKNKAEIDAIVNRAFELLR